MLPTLFGLRLVGSGRMAGKFLCGRFRLLLFQGLIYRLRYPLLALDRIFDLTSNRLFAEPSSLYLLSRNSAGRTGRFYWPEKNNSTAAAQNGATSSA
jgi:hypothetical protein